MAEQKKYKQKLSPAKRKSLLKRSIPIYIMALPGLIYMFINNYMPMPGIILAFKNYKAKNGIYGSKWAGLKNFKYLFSTQDAFIITRNTICYNLVFIIVNTVFAILIAIILSELTHKIKKVYQSVILLPYLLSAVIISYLVFAFLSAENGFINNSIFRLLGKDPISWYQEKQYWPFILVFVNLWKGIGYNCIIYLSTIIGFDRSYYEAAAIDGATKWQQIKSITLPLLRPTIIMLTLMAIGRIFYSDFGLFYQVPQNSGALLQVTNTIDTYVYRGLIELGDITMSAAAGVYQSIVGFILVMAANLAVRKLDPDSALF
ncbi:MULTISPECIES: ABC transporter permease [unclassified Butyrivibrio]|uniref:ABC transporter permease n=1 Tax=unclassified Butyrivibrio TaxID=2639466 RepID=UPI0003FCC02F|nr:MULTISPECIES: ABC transporter permease subunit [unclassified Butyrivibrio]